MSEKSFNRTDAIRLLLKDVKKVDLNNLLSLIAGYFKKTNNIELSEDECYEITQGKVSDILDSKNINLRIDDAKLWKTILELSYKCIDDGNNLGDNVLGDSKNINTSSWISHSLRMARVAQTIAGSLNIDSEEVFIKGLIHDIGRKKTHTFDHTAEGYKYLRENGCPTKYAIAALTHSFIKDKTGKGGRWANCENPTGDFKIDDKGIPILSDEDKYTKFLEEYGMYSINDTVLNIADLMASTDKIMTPADRVADVFSRRDKKGANYHYFLAEFSNCMIEVLEKVKSKPECGETRISDLGNNHEEIEKKFKEISDRFYREYMSMEKKQEDSDPNDNFDI